MTSFGQYPPLLMFLGICTVLLTLKTPLISALQVRLPVPTRAPLSTPTKSRLYSTPPDATSNNEADYSRRGFLSTALSTPLILAASPQPAHAGLAKFPCTTLKNRYHFMRAGPSELETDGIYSTNPLFLTNRENGLAGPKAVLDACAKIRDNPNFPTVAYHSLAANGMDTGDIVATELQISRDRLLPEFTYLDQRGVGLWDSGDEDLVKPAIAALDYLEGGKNGVGGRPPANEDGTPNETLGDQFVRLRQFLSLQESRTSGENILIIFPDGTGPALLSAMIAGIPLNEAHCLDYKPGEVRLDISRDSILRLYEQKKDDPAYLAMLQDGKEKLALLRDQEGENVVNLKDQLRDKERAVLDQEFDLKKQQERQEEERKREEIRQVQLEREQEQRERAEQQQAEREEAAAAKKAEQEAKRAEQLAVLKAAKEEKEAAKREQQAALARKDSSKQGDGGMDLSAMVGALGVGMVGIGAAAVLGGGGEDQAEQKAIVPEPAPVPNPSSNTVVVAANGTAAVAFSASTSLPAVDDATTTTTDLPLPKSSSSRARPASAIPEQIVVGREEEKDTNTAMASSPTLDEDKPEDPKPSSAIEDELNSLEAAQKALFNTIDSIPPPTTNKEEQPTDSVEDEMSIPPEEEEEEPIQSTDYSVQDEMNLLEANQEAMNGYLEMDDGGSDWLQVLAQIRDEPDEEADRVNGEGK